MLVKSGGDYAGRVGYFRILAALGGTGILQSTVPDDTWKTLRKASHKHLRQFGDGLSKLESIIVLVAEDMFTEFHTNIGKPLDPRQIVLDTSLNSIAFLITGERTRNGDAIVENLRACEALYFKCVPLNSVSWGMRFLDAFPWLRHFGWPSWDMFERFLATEKRIWQNIQEMHNVNAEASGLVKVLQNYPDGHLTETDIRKTALSLLIAGLETTSMTFYGAINLLAHHPDIQTKIHIEIEEVTGGRRDIGLPDRPKMSYTRAVILELLRYTSVVHNGVGHRTTKQTCLNGYKLPKDLIIITCLYNMHHDTEFWVDPEKFQPERFLDARGEVVPADHPNRKHLMPFGAGMRVCLGESLALTRLFLWITTMVQRFQVEPAPGNDMSTTDTRSFHCAGVIKPPPYEVIFNKR